MARAGVAATVRATRAMVKARFSIEWKDMRCVRSARKTVATALSARSRHPLEGDGNDLGQTLGGLEAGQFLGLEPARLGQFLVQLRLARDPARGKAHDDEMTRHPLVVVAHHHLAVTGQCHRLDDHRGLFGNLADQRFDQRLAGLDHAARHGPDAERGAAGAARDQHAAITDDGGADGEKGAVGVGAGVGCGVHRPNIASTAACGPRWSAVSAGVPLIKAAVRAISGRSRSRARRTIASTSAVPICWSTSSRVRHTIALSTSEVRSSAARTAGSALWYAAMIVSRLLKWE